MNKPWLSILAIMFASTLFLTFPSVRIAHEQADAGTELTPHDMVWAKKSLELYRNGYYMQPFLFSSDYISPHNYTWELMSHLTFLFLIFTIITKSRGTEYEYYRWFFAISFVNMVDAMVLTHSNPYFYIQEFPVTYNVLAIPVFICIAFVTEHAHGNSRRGF